MEQRRFFDVARKEDVEEREPVMIPDRAWKDLLSWRFPVVRQGCNETFLLHRILRDRPLSSQVALPPVRVLFRYPRRRLETL